MSQYLGVAEVAIVALDGALQTGDTLHFRGHTTDFYQRVERLEIDHQRVSSARGGSVAIAVTQRVREGDGVFRLSR